jgi:hypothetical protein
MKRILLLMLGIVISAGMFAQKPQADKAFAKPVGPQLKQQFMVEPIGTKPVFMAPEPIAPESVTSPDAVTIIDLGTSSNPYGMSGTGRTLVWADNQINAVGFVHRMNGDLMAGASIAFDYSFDGGATWGKNVKVYVPLGPPLPGQTYPQAAGRYPQGVLFNPAGNSDPRNSYFHYHIPTLDGSNPGTGSSTSSWGGIGYGVRKGDTVAPATQHNETSGNGFFHNIPDAMTLAGDKAFVVEPIFYGGYYNTYPDSLMISKGVWNTTTNDFDYTFSRLYAPADWNVTDSRVAFAPNGQTGYLSIIAHNAFKPLDDSTYYPILYKTIDGGNTWTGPINVDMYGDFAIPEVKNYLHDTVLFAMYGYVPDRDSIVYTTIGNHDLAVDINGNPHIGVVVSMATGDYGTYFPKTCTLFDLYSTDGGTTWHGVALDTISNQWGTFGTGSNTVSEDNRVQVSRTEDGSRIFVSWLDTQPPASPSNNTAPNIFIRGLNMWTNTMTPVLNVTKFTLAYTQAYMATQSHVVFHSAGSYGIPFVYQAMNPTDATQPVQFKYIHNYKITDAQFNLPMNTTVFEQPGLEVSQNYPNPCQGSTTIGVELDKTNTVSVEVVNLIGQKVLSVPAKTMGSGIHEIRLDLNSFEAGVYFYTVTVGKQSITKKMIVN